MAVDKGNLKNVIKIKEADYNTILDAYPASATISIEGVSTSVTFDPAALYLIDKTTPDLPEIPATVSSAKVPILGTNGVISWQNKWGEPDLYCHNIDLIFNLNDNTGTYTGRASTQLWLPNSSSFYTFDGLRSALNAITYQPVFPASGFAKMNGYTNRDVIITGISADSNIINLAGVTISAGSVNTVELTSSYEVDVTDIIYGSAYSYIED